MKVGEVELALDTVVVRNGSSLNSEVDSQGPSPYGKWVHNLKKEQGYDRSVKEKYFKDGQSPSESQNEQIESEKVRMMKKRQQKIKKEYQEAQKINDMRLKEFMKKQHLMKEQRAKDSQVSSLKDQINAAIQRSNKSKSINNF